MSKEMAREIKEILEGADPAQVAEFAGKAATAADAQVVKELAAGYGIQLADDEAGGIFAEMTRRSQEEISIDELDNVAGGCDDYDPFPCQLYWC